VPAYSGVASLPLISFTRAETKYPRNVELHCYTGSVNNIFPSAEINKNDDGCKIANNALENVCTPMVCHSFQSSSHVCKGIMVLRHPTSRMEDIELTIRSNYFKQ
jgi:hypothetical protein